MKLTIITPTCRTEPRFADMADTIAANQKAVPMDLLWVVVDDRLWHPGAEERKKSLIDAVKGRFLISHLPPKPSLVRGPSRVAEADLPDHNGARNTGLILAMAMEREDHYVLFLDDCTLLTQSVFAVVQEAAKKSAGLRVPIAVERDLNVPRDGRVPNHELGGLHLVSCKATTIAGGCFGAPLEAFLSVGGMDEAYAGDAGKEDLDVAVRMARAGWAFLTTKRCAAIQLTRTHTKAEVTTVEEALRGKKNQILWQSLQKARTRTEPLKRGLDDALAPPARPVAIPDVTAAPVAAVAAVPPPAGDLVPVLAEGTEVKPPEKKPPRQLPM